MTQEMFDKYLTPATFRYHLKMWVQHARRWHGRLGEKPTLVVRFEDFKADCKGPTSPPVTASPHTHPGGLCTGCSPMFTCEADRGAGAGAGLVRDEAAVSPPARLPTCWSQRCQRARRDARLECACHKDHRAKRHTAFTPHFSPEMLNQATLSVRSHQPRSHLSKATFSWLRVPSAAGIAHRRPQR